MTTKKDLVLQGHRPERRAHHRPRRAHPPPARARLQGVQDRAAGRGDARASSGSSRGAASRSPACGPRRAGAKDGPTFALLGELDGLVVAGHPIADPETGAAHACGHNAQMAGLLGAAMGLCEAQAPSSIWPAAWSSSRCPRRSTATSSGASQQARAGRLEFLGGKPELLRLGHFDDVDLAMMIHTTSQPEMKKAGVAASNNGCLVKTVRYIGRASHAGGAPHMGINALYAANIGLSAINAHPRDLPRRGLDPRAPDHHPRRQPGERDPGRGAPRDLRARQDGGGDPRGQPPGGPGAPRRARSRWAPRWRSRRCPATCRSSTTWAWRSSSRPTRPRSWAPTR